MSIGAAIHRQPCLRYYFDSANAVNVGRRYLYSLADDCLMGIRVHEGSASVDSPPFRPERRRGGDNGYDTADLREMEARIVRGNNAPPYQTESRLRPQVEVRRIIARLQNRDGDWRRMS